VAVEMEEIEREIGELLGPARAHRLGQLSMCVTPLSPGAAISPSSTIAGRWRDES